jgi:hypothetical protein
VEIIQLVLTPHFRGFNFDNLEQQFKIWVESKFIEILYGCDTSCGGQPCEYWTEMGK